MLFELGGAAGSFVSMTYIPPFPAVSPYSYTIEVENALLSHGTLMEACVFGVSEKILGEEVGFSSRRPDINLPPYFSSKISLFCLSLLV